MALFWDLVETTAKPMVSTILFAACFFNSITTLFVIFSLRLDVPVPNFLTRLFVALSFALVFGAFQVRAAYGQRYSIVLESLDRRERHGKKSLWLSAIFRKH
jgi:hypothetical protein